MTRVPISIEVRFLRIPARWTVQESGIAVPGRRRFVPEVVRPIQPKFSTEDYGEWRNQFLRLRGEESVLEFLNNVGVWDAVQDDTIPPRHASMDISGTYGFRLFNGRAMWVGIEEFTQQQEFWKSLLGDKKALRQMFGPPPSDDARPIDKLRFAATTHSLNEIPLHIEWRKGRPQGPQGVFQPITFRELLITALHVDLLSDAKFQVCQRPDCAIPFTGRKRRYCQWYCGHIESVRRERR